jgi:uncharacterized protein
MTKACRFVCEWQRKLGRAFLGMRSNRQMRDSAIGDPLRAVPRVCATITYSIEHTTEHSAMSLKEQITEDMKAAMRAKDSERLGTIRLLTAAMKQKEVDDRVELDDAMVVAIVDKLIKQRKDSIEAFTKADRMDLADKEKSEMVVLQAYLPARMSAEEVTVAVKAIVAELGASGPGDMGKVMGAVKAALAGKAEMGQVSAAVKAALAG